jgi:hypothetical protein
MLLAALCSAGCATNGPVPEPVVRTVEVRVPVAVPCIETMPTRPLIYTRAEILARPNAEAAALLLDQVNVRDGYIGELEAVAAPCAATEFPFHSSAH